MNPRPKPKKEIGIVVSKKMNKTAIVAIEKLFMHPSYQKAIRRSRKVYAHDEKNTVQAGDKVVMVETRPMSKTKRWRIVKILEKAKLSQDIKLIIDEPESRDAGINKTGETIKEIKS